GRLVLGDQRRHHLGVGRGAHRHPPRPQLLAQLGGVRQVAVVAEGDGAPTGVADDRLRVLPHRRPGGRVPGVADRDVALEAGKARLVEHLADEAHVFHRGDARAVRNGDAGALLAPVLQREEAEEGRAGDVAVGPAGRRVDAEDAAHQAPPSMIRGSAPSYRSIASARAIRAGPTAISPPPTVPIRFSGTGPSPRRAETTTRPSPSPKRSGASSTRTPMPPAIADSATATARPPPPTSWALRSSLRPAASARNACSARSASRSG